MPLNAGIHWRVRGETLWRSRHWLLTNTSMQTIGRKVQTVLGVDGGPIVSMLETIGKDVRQCYGES